MSISIEQVVAIAVSAAINASKLMSQPESSTTQNAPAPSLFWVPGRAYFIRTVTNYYVGKLVRMEGANAILTNCAWIPDAGRFNEAIAKGTFSECEPYPNDMEVCVNTGACIDACEWKHALPIGVK